MNIFDSMKQMVSSKNPVIVFPEGTSDRILRATIRLKQEGIMQPIILGNEEQIKQFASEKCLDISNLTLIDPQTYPELDFLVEKFVERRKGKIATEEARAKLLSDVNYFGTMLVYTDKAAGMVSGAVHTTGETVRPALQIIKVKPCYTRTSGVFILIKGDQIYVVADCAINIAPNAEELAEIAITTVDTAKSIGLDPRVAMLSFSTRGSAQSEETERMAKATELVRQQLPDLLIDGEIQFDAAFVPEIADRKAPNSPIGGNANVFIFPSLEAGNIGYKLIQRFGGYDAVGPILQGLNKPVCDLSRGCNEEEVYKLALFTAASGMLDSGCEDKQSR